MTLEAAIGQYALSPKQLEQAGILKPGASVTAEALIARGANLSQGLPSYLFKGKPGAENLASFVNNVPAQGDAAVTLLQKSQTQLTNAGLITGKEASSQIGGVVMAGVTTGVEPTLDAVKTASTNLTGSPISSATAAELVLGQSGEAFGAIGAGCFAGQFADGVIGGLSPVNDSLNAMIETPSLSSLVNQTQGVSAGAFNAIKNSLPTLKPYVPQNLKEINKKQAAKVAAVDVTVGGVKFSPDELATFDNELLTSLEGQIGGVSSNIAGSGQGLYQDIEQKAGIDFLMALNDSEDTSIGSVLDNLNAEPEIMASTSFGGLSDLVQTNSLASTATEFAKGGSASSSSILSSGIDNLVGGFGITGAVVNKATGQLKNAKDVLGALQGTLENVSSSVMNGINLKDIPGAKGIDQLKSLVTSGLPPALASQLQAQVAAISSGGPIPVKLPTIGINTVADRGSLASQITNLLGDPNIPAPNLLGEVSEQAKSDLEQQQAATDDKYQAFLEYSEYLQKEKAAKAALYNAEANLPQGDPEIKRLEDAYFALVTDPKIEDIAKRAGMIATAEATAKLRKEREADNRSLEEVQVTARRVGGQTTGQTAPSQSDPYGSEAFGPGSGYLEG